jgi:hypothetical protein
MTIVTHHHRTKRPHRKKAVAIKVPTVVVRPRGARLG